jgi:quercetin dioxygenase-like cupin family protein
MIKTEHYSSLEEAFDTCMAKDHDHVLIRHSYKKGLKIHPHRHDAYEWVIATHGHFMVESEGDQKEFNLEGNETVVIHYPAGTEHALTVLGEVLDYFVMRDR